jgi:hypothetical protein
MRKANDAPIDNWSEAPRPTDVLTLVPGHDRSMSLIEI